MGDTHWWGEERPKLHCTDYVVGKYHPVSFGTKLSWEIVYHEPDTRFFMARAKLYENLNEEPAYLIIRSSGSFGRMRLFTSGLPYQFSFVGDTNDPEDAMFLVERSIVKVSKDWAVFYRQLSEIVESI